MARKKKNLTEFGITIRKKLLEKNMTLTELSEKLGVKQEYLSSVLHGKRAGKKYIDKINKVLQLENESK